MLKNKVVNTSFNNYKKDYKKIVSIKNKVSKEIYIKYLEKVIKVMLKYEEKLKVFPMGKYPLQTHKTL